MLRYVSYHSEHLLDFSIPTGGMNGMFKKRIAKIGLAVAAAPIMIMGTAGSAFANVGSVSWTNNWSGERLCAFSNSTTVYTCANTDAVTRWVDVQNSDGSWNEVDSFGRCLTAYYRTVYVESCNNNADGTNWWERWYEIQTPTGWKLQNRETGYILDENNAYTVYANVNDAGNGDGNQRWS